MYVCMHVCVLWHFVLVQRESEGVYICVCARVCMYVCLYVFMYVCMYVRVIRIFSMNTSRIRGSGYMHVFVYVCIYVCMYVCVI